jgi:hypothetical protein
MNSPRLPGLHSLLSSSTIAGTRAWIVVGTDQAAVTLGHAVDFQQLGIETFLELVPLLCRGSRTYHQSDGVVAVIISRFLLEGSRPTISMQRSGQR